MGEAFGKIAGLQEGRAIEAFWSAAGSAGKKYLLLGGFLLFTALCALGAQTTWDGSSSTDWADGTNWSAGVPGAGDNATIPNGLGTYPVLTAAATTQNLTIENGATLGLGAFNLAVTGTLQVDAGGSLSGASGDLTVSGTASLGDDVNVSGGDATFSGGVTLTADVVLTGATVTFNDTVAGGANSLTVTGDAVFGNGTGDTVTGVSNLSVSGTTAINTNTVTTSGTQGYTGAVTLGTGATLTGTTPTFGAGVTGGGNNLTLSFSGTTALDGATFTGIADLLSDNGGGTEITGSLTTTGTQRYDDNVTLTGNATLSGSTITFNGTVSGGTNSLTITGNAVFGNGTGDTVTGVSSLSVSGTTQINTDTVTSSGTQGYDGAVTLGANATLTGSTVTFQGSVAGGTNSLTVTGNAVFGNGTGDTVTGVSNLSVSGTTQINTNTVTTSGTQGYTGAVTLGTGATLTGTTPTFGAGVTGGGNNLTLSFSGTTALDGATFTGIADLLSDNGGGTEITGSLTTTGTQRYDDNATLTGNATLSGSTITFNGTVAGGTNSLTVTGDAVFGNGAADTVTGVSSLSVSGTTQINTNTVTSSGTQGYDGAVTLGANATLTGSTVTFQGTVAGGTNSLSVTGNAAFGNGAADTVTGVSNLSVSGTTQINTNTVTTSGTQGYTGAVTLGTDATLTGTTPTFGAGVTGGGNNLTLSFSGTTALDGATFTGIADLLSDNGGGTEITGALTTTGTQRYDDNVTLTGNTTLAGTTITFNGTVAGATNSLTVTGDAVFGNGAADTVTGVSSLSVSGTTQINTNTVTTSGTQTYSGAVTLGANATLTGSTVTFNGTVAGGTNSLTVTGNAVFGNGAADTVTGVSNLSVSGTTQINTNTITTSGTQGYTGAVTLGTDATLTGTTPTFGAGVTGGGNNLTLSFSGTTALDGATFTGIADLLSDNGGGTEITGSLTTTGTQRYDDNVTLTGNATLAGTTVTFNGTVAGGTNSLTVTGNAVFGNGTGDTVTGVSNLSVSGTTQINTNTVTTSGTQGYTGAVTLGTGVTLTGTTPTFGAGVTGGGNNLTLSFSGTTTLDGATFTGIADLLSDNGGGTEITGSLTTTGTQRYDDNVTLTGNATLSGSTITFNGTVAGGTNSLTVTGNAVFGNGAADTVTGLSALSVSGTAAVNTNTVSSTGTQLYAGAVTLGSDTTLTGTTVTFQGTLAGATNSLTVTGNAVFGNGTGDTVTGVNNLSVSGTTQINTNTVTTSGTQGYTGAVTLGTGATLTGTTPTFGAGVTGGGNNLTLSFSGTTALDGATFTGIADLLSDNGGGTEITGSLTTTGTQRYDDNVTLTGNATLAGSTITFNGTVAGGTNSLTVTGNAVFGNGAADTVTGVSNLSVSGTTQINTNTVTSSGTQTYSGAVTLGTDTTLMGSTVTFNGTVTGAANSLTVTGDAVFGNGAADRVTGVSSLSVSGTAGINTDTVTTTGTQTYSGAATLGTNTTLTGSTVTFQGTVAGGTNSLTVTGDAVFGNGAVDTVTGVSSLSVSGTAQINTNTVTSSGTQGYDGAVTLGANATLTGSTVTFQGTVAGGTNSLTVTGNAVFGNGAADTVTGVSNLSVSGTTQINTNTVTATGTQTYTGAVTLGADATLTGTTPTFGAGVTGGGNNLTLSFSGTTALDGATFTGIADLLSDNGGGTEITGVLTTTGTQRYDDNVTLSGNATLAGSTITFNGTVAGATNSLTVTGDAVFGNGAADTVTGVSSLSVSGTTQINTNTVTASGTQTYAGAVTLGSDTTLTGTTVTFNGTVAGATNSLSVTGDAVFGNGAADTVTGVNNLSVSGTTQINTNTVTTTGTQGYTGAVTLGADATLTGTTPTFGAGVTGGGNNLTLSFSGTTALDGATFTGIADLLSDNGGGTEITGALTTTGTQRYDDNVTLTGNATLAGTTVTFNGTVAGGTNSLTVTGDAVFGNGAADTVTGVSSLSVSGTTQVNTNTVTASGTQTYAGAVTLGSDTTLTGTTVTFNGTVAGATNSLTVTGDAVFGNGTGDTVTGVNNLSVSGTTQINTDTVTSSGSQTYTGAATLGTSLTLTGSTVTFNGTVTGGTNSLTVTGDAVFGDGAADTVTGVMVLSVSGTAGINTNTVTSSGAQTYAGAVTLGANATLTGSTITFNGTVAGGTNSLTVTGDAVFGDGTADTVTGVSNLSVSGTTQINTNTVTATGTQTYSGAATLGANSTLTGSTVTFNGTVTGGSNSLTVTGNAVFGDGAADTVTGVSSLSVSGTTQINTNTVTTTGAQSFTGAATIGASATVSSTGSGDITFSGTVDSFDGTQSLTVNSSADITLSGALGNGSAFTSLTLSGTDIALSGIGGAAVGVSGAAAVTAAAGIELYGGDYKTGDKQSYNSGSEGTVWLHTVSGAFQVTGGTQEVEFDDIYLDYSGAVTVTLQTPVSAGRIAFYNGTLNLNGQTLDSEENGGGDFAVFGGSFSNDDPDWNGADTRFEYPGLSSLSRARPGGLSAALSSAVSGSTIQVGGNFYVNGTDLDNLNNWNLTVQDNSGASPAYNNGTGTTSWGSTYNLAFNLRVDNSTLTGGSISAAMPAAGTPAESNHNVDSASTGNTLYDPSGPTPGWDFARPQISSVETVWDNVLKVTFSEPIENSNNEIAAALTATLIQVDNNSYAVTDSYIAFNESTGVAGASTNGAGDLSVVYFSTSLIRWNTDATGSSAGNADTFSSDSLGNHRSSLPNLSFIKSALYDAGGKNPIRNYNQNGFAVYSGATDGAGPVVAGVKAGTAAYNSNPAAAPSNGHNYFTLRYSERVNFNTTGTVLGTATGSDNVRVGTYQLDGGRMLGHMADQHSSGTVTLDGLITYTGIFDSGVIPADGNGYVNSVDRSNVYEIRVNIAGFYDTGNSRWPGFLGETGVVLTDPHGLAFNGVADARVLDLAGNASTAAGTGRTVNQNMGFAAGSDWNAITETGWDVDPPALAPYVVAGINEIIPLDNTVNTLLDRFEFHLLDDSADAAAWDSDTMHIDTNKGMRDNTLLAVNAFTFEAAGLTPLVNTYNISFATDVDNDLFDANPINTADDPYFSVNIQDSVHIWNTLTKIWASYDEDSGYFTDRAGNRLRSFSQQRALESIPPDISLTLAAPGNDWVYVKFSESVYGNNSASAPIDAGDFSLTGTALTIAAVASWPGNGDNTEFRFTLSGALSENDIIDTRIAVSPVSVFDEEGNAYLYQLVHRVSDLGFNIVEPLWASDGIHSEDIREGTSLTQFDGTGRLMDRDIQLQARIHASNAQNRAMSLYFDADVPDSQLTDGVWLPFYQKELAPEGNYSSRFVGASSILGNGLQEFVIPSTDEDMDAGNTMQFLFMLGDLPCVDLVDENDIMSYRLWSFRVEDIRKQRGGVTILNNIINPQDGEEAILIYDLDDPGVVSVQVFALNGSMVRILHRGRQAEGTYQYLWDGRNHGGRIVARGVYFIRVVGPDTDEVRKVLIVK